MNNVVSKSIAQQLKEAGWSREAYFYWVERWMPHQDKPWILDNKKHGNWLPAPTAIELFEEIGEGYTILYSGDAWIPYKVVDSGMETEELPEDHEAHSRLSSVWKKIEVVEGLAMTPQDALAKLWLTLKEEGLLD